MPRAKLTSKGQVTIPAEVRTDLALRAGDRVDFVRRADGVYEIIPARVDIMSLKGIVPKAKRPVSIEDMDRAIGEAVAKRFDRSRR